MSTPDELFLTFEDGLHVGVFKDPLRAEALNDARRAKREVNPETVRYVRGDVVDRRIVEVRRAADGEVIVAQERVAAIQQAWKTDQDTRRHHVDVRANAKADQATLALVDALNQRDKLRQQVGELAKQYADMKAYAEHLETKLERARIATTKFAKDGYVVDGHAARHDPECYVYQLREALK